MLLQKLSIRDNQFIKKLDFLNFSPLIMLDNDIHVICIIYVVWCFFVVVVFQLGHRAQIKVFSKSPKTPLYFSLDVKVIHVLFTKTVTKYLSFYETKPLHSL